MWTPCDARDLIGQCDKLRNAFALCCVDDDKCKYVTSPSWGTRVRISDTVAVFFHLNEEYTEVKASKILKILKLVSGDVYGCENTQLEKS